MLKHNFLQKILVLCVFILIVTVYFPVSSIAAAHVDLDLSIKAGYDDTVKIGFSVPFYVHLKNNGSEMSGELQIIINNNPDSRSVFSMDFTLPQNSDKELVLNVPINTIDRNIEVNVLKGNKTIKSIKYEFKKFISPDTPLIGVLSDDPNSIKGLNELNLSDFHFPGLSSDMEMKMKVMAASGERVSTANKLTEQIYLSTVNMPDDIDALNAFDILLINNFDTSSLTQKQKDCLQNWVSRGNILIVGTGPNWKKVYGGLPTSLKPFKIEGTKTITSAPSLGKFAGKKAPSGNLNIVTGNVENGRIAAIEESSPLISNYRVENGFVSILTFDPALSPINSWDDVQAFWKNLISSVFITSVTGTEAVVTPMMHTGGMYMNLNHLTSNVPEVQTPPYKFLLIMIGFYVLIAGPILYIILKWCDKRDWSWVFIPMAAFLFLGIIYFAGFKTRFNTAVLNNISVINISPGLDKYQVNSTMGVFNNKRGTLKIQYPSDSNIIVNPNYYTDYGYYPSQDSTNKDGVIISKLSYSDPRVYELYQARLWQPAYMTAEKAIASKGEVMNTVSLIDGKLKTVIKNTTGFPLKDAFIAIGNNFIEVGDIDPSDEKIIDVLLDSSKVHKRLESFLDARYGQNYNVPRSDRTKQWAENNRKRNILQNVFSSIPLTNSSQPSISLFAFNYDDPGYELTINNQNPKVYNTNIIYSTMTMNFEKNKKVTLPTGIVKAVFNQGDNKFAYMEDPSQGGIRVHEDADVDFTVSLPSTLNIENIKIIWDNVVPGYVKYQSKNQGQKYAQNTYKYYIFNNSTGNWDEISSGQVIDQNISFYVNNNREIKLRANVTVDKSASPGELLGTPDLEISGVMK